MAARAKGSDQSNARHLVISVNPKKLFNIIPKLKNQLIFVTDKIEQGRKFVSQSEKRVSESYM